MQSSLPDIRSEDDVQKFVDSFYDKVVQDDLLGPVFNDVAQVDWSTHLPTMYSFWSAILLGKPGYNGAPFPVHAALREHITANHFTRWLQLFEATIDCLFEGQLADAAKQRARNIAIVFQAKLGLLHQQAPVAD
jgi:hemoglobin